MNLNINRFLSKNETDGLEVHGVNDSDTIAFHGVNDLVKLYQVLGCFEGAQRHLIREHEEHIRKLLDFTINVKIIERFTHWLNQTEFQLNHSQELGMKCNILICLNYITIGFGFIIKPEGLQSYNKQSSTKIDP